MKNCKKYLKRERFSKKISQSDQLKINGINIQNHLNIFLKQTSIEINTLINKGVCSTITIKLKITKTKLLDVHFYINGKE